MKLTSQLTEKQQKARFRRFLKSRKGQMLELRQDIENYTAHQYCQTPFNLKSHLAAALWIATKGTKMEEDSKKIIKILVPLFFHNEQELENELLVGNKKDGLV